MRTGTNWAIRTLTMVVAGVGLAACGGGDLAKDLGLKPTPPDEFQVVRKAPLSLPPSYSLRPPSPGAQRPQELVPVESAKKSVFRLADQNKSVVGDLPQGERRGEAAFLARAGTGEAMPDIRQVLAEEATLIATADRSFLDDLLFWQEPVRGDRTRLDARAEDRRLKENAASGRGPDEGANPVIIERRENSLFSF